MNRGYSSYGEVRLGHFFTLGNWPHMLDNGPHLFPWDVLSLRTFCPLGRFVPGMFCPLWRFVPGTFCPWNVLSLGRFVLGHFVLGRFVLGSFVCASKISRNWINYVPQPTNSSDDLCLFFCIYPSFMLPPFCLETYNVMHAWELYFYGEDRKTCKLS